jgi:hypothetical protein
MRENLGKLGRDKVTGFEGVITAWVVHLTGCDAYILKPKAVDNKCGDACQFDIGRVEIIGDAIKMDDVKGNKPGGEDIPLTKNN